MAVPSPFSSDKISSPRPVKRRCRSPPSKKLITFSAMVFPTSAHSMLSIFSFALLNIFTALSVNSEKDDDSSKLVSFPSAVVAPCTNLRIAGVILSESAILKPSSALSHAAISPSRLSVMVSYCFAASPMPSLDPESALAHSFCLSVPVTTILLYAFNP